MRPGRKRGARHFFGEEQHGPTSNTPLRSPLNTVAHSAILPAASRINVVDATLFSLTPSPSFSSIMSGPSDLDFHDTEELESRALLPAQNSRNQQRAGNASDPTGAHTSGQPEDVSGLNDRDIWRHFESTKRSAIFHLDEYLHHREIVRQEVGTGELGSLDLGKTRTSIVGIPSRHCANT